MNQTSTSLHSLGLLEDTYDETEDGAIDGTPLTNEEGIDDGSYDGEEVGSLVGHTPHVTGQLTFAIISKHLFSLSKLMKKHHLKLLSIQINLLFESSFPSQSILGKELGSDVGFNDLTLGTSEGINTTLVGAKVGIVVETNVEDGDSLEQRPHVIGQLTLATSSIHRSVFTQG